MLSENKILLQDLKEVKENIFIVNSVHYFPIKSGINTENGILIHKEDFPIIDNKIIETMDYRLYYNKATNKAYYEYFERPKTEEDLLKDEIKELKLQQQTTDKITADLAYELMMLKGVN